MRSPEANESSRLRRIEREETVPRQRFPDWTPAYAGVTVNSDDVTTNIELAHHGKKSQAPDE
jgi:hypothetical protein